MKVARTVIAGGKAGDNIKRLPIGKVAYPVAPATGVAPTQQRYRAFNIPPFIARGYIFFAQFLNISLLINKKCAARSRA